MAQHLPVLAPIAMRITAAASARQPASDIWGDVPTWIIAVSTTIGLLFAFAAAIVALRTYQIEQKRESIADDERRAEINRQRMTQATMVSAWSGNGAASSGGRNADGLFVRNASETPVYDGVVTISSPLSNGALGKIRCDVIPPTKQPVFFPKSQVTWSTGRSPSAWPPTTT